MNDENRYPVVQLPKLHSEKLFPLIKAVELATGHKPAQSTVLRWANKETGIRLESRILGGLRMTSKEAVLRFMEAGTEARDNERTAKNKEV